VTVRNPPTPVTIAFGRRARELRQEREWTLNKGASRTQLAPSTLCRIEQGMDTTLSTAERIAAAYWVPLAVMLSPETCANCHDAPGRGFTCQECGTAGPAVTR
jgi:transcriptional regulator with XRE-family HTH domain